MEGAMAAKGCEREKYSAGKKKTRKDVKGKLIPTAKEEIWVKVVFGKRVRTHDSTGKSLRAKNCSQKRKKKFLSQM